MRPSKNIKSFHLRMRQHPTGERSPAQLQTKNLHTLSFLALSQLGEGDPAQHLEWFKSPLSVGHCFKSSPPLTLSFLSPKRELVKERNAYERLSPHRNLSLKQNTDFLDGLRAYFCTQADRTKWTLPSTRNLTSRYEPKNTGLSA